MTTPMYVDGATAVQASRQFMTAAHRLPSLFEIEDLGYQLLALLDDDPDNAELEAQLALVDQMLIGKTESYCSVIRSLEAMADARKAEADRLAARAKTAQRHADFLKQRLLVHLKTAGRDRVEMARFTLSIRTNPPAVQITDATAIPSEFTRTTITVNPDKVAILAAFKRDGEIVPGTEITRSERLAIQ